MEIRERVIERSLALFVKKGCKSVTMDEIAQENGISKRTLYELFKDKDELLEESLYLMFRTMHQKLSGYKGQFSNVIEAFYRVHHDRNYMLAEIKKNFFEELRRYHAPIFEKSIGMILEFHQSMVISFLERGQSEGMIAAEIDKELVAKVMVEIANLMENNHFFSLKEYGKTKFFKHSMLIYIRGLCTIKGVEQLDHYFETRKR